jgi:hypothetical protein
MNRVFVAVGTEFFQFHPSCGVTTVFLRGIPGYPCGTLVGIGATFGALQRYHDPNAFSHGLLAVELDTIVYYDIGLNPWIWILKVCCLSCITPGKRGRFANRPYVNWD